MEEEKSLSEISFKADKFQDSPLFTTPATTVDRSLRLRAKKENGKQVGERKLAELQAKYEKLLNKIPKELCLRENEALNLCEDEIHEVLRSFQERETTKIKKSKLYEKGQKMIKEIEEVQQKLLSGAYQDQPFCPLMVVGKFQYFLEELGESLKANFELQTKLQKEKLAHFLKNNVILRIEEKKKL